MKKALLGIVMCGAWAQQAWACGTVEEEGAAPIAVNSEAAIITWDAKTKTEHFIRRASFDSSGKSMGFIVPTPGVPTLSAASDEIFASLENVQKPETVTTKQTGYRFDWLVVPDKTERASARVSVSAPSQSTVVLPARGVAKVRRQVGDYDATILQAKDERALEKWLKANNFKTDASLRAWLRPYVQRGWSLTAFKIRSGKGSAELAPVRLTFKTDKPYYPYREPASARAKGAWKAGRTLKVYYLAPKRVVGGIGESANWPGQTQWTAALPDGARKDLMRGAALPQNAIPAGTQLTVFQDSAAPRPGTDEVFFRAAKDQTELKPQPMVKTIDARTKIPLEFLILGIVGTSVGAMKLTNRRFDKRK